jgi:serine/threonine-protein kinase
MNDAPPRLAAALADRYRLERELGAGGMATVYLAEDVRHRRKVAIKVLRPELAAALGAERFLREIETTASLRHPHILPLYDSGESAGFLFYVMPLVEGGSLRGRLEREQRLPLQDALRIGREVADALGYAHGRGVVHRDIKPENILLESGHAVVADFGIARALDAAGGQRMTGTGLAIGTPAYMSPEQATGERDLDGRSDLYSLGCVLFEMITGNPPFRGATAAAVIAKRFTEQPPELGGVAPSVPPAVASVVRRLMATDPAQRPANGAEASTALGRSITGDGTATVEHDSGAERARARLPWIAVLPFASRDAALADLAEGLAEDLTTGLSRFTHLQVITRQSVASLPPGSDVRRVGEALGARYVVEGSLRKSGNTMRLSAQLVDTQTGTHLWAETFDRDLTTTNLFALQDDLTDRIVATVADPFGVLVRVMAHPLLEKPVEELTASELCIRLYAHQQQLGPEEHARLRSGFELALMREPHHADAWANLATIYWGEKMHGLNPLPDPLARARKAADRAVQIDSANQNAWAALASVQYFSGDLTAFRQSAERTLSLNPRNTSNNAVVAMLISYSGEWDRGYELIQRMMALNPHHAGWFHFVPTNYHIKKGDYEAALAAVKRVNMPQFPWTYTNTAVICAALGRWDEARRAADTLRRLFPAIALGAGRGRSGWFYDPELEDRENALLLQALALEETPSPAPAQTTQSVAVLPFANMSGSADDEYFSDGVSEEIINALTQLPGLRVAARTSAFSFKGKNEDLRTVGEKLGVMTVLEGSVRRSGSTLRITAQLISVADGYHLWSERYDREATDIFAIQDEIAGAIASKLKLTMGTGTVRARGPSPSLEAYDLLLKGRALLWQRGRAILDALPWLERAAALDPTLVEAHALLGDAWRLKWLYGMAPAAETIPRAREAIARALALDAENPQALAALANIEAVHDHLYERSLATSARALARDPRFVQALCERAVWLSLRREWPAERLAESLAHVRAARSIDPLSSWAAAIEVFVLLSLRRDEDAVRVGHEAVSLDPGAFTARWALVWALSALGRDDEALALARETLPMSGRNPRILTEMAALHVRRGEPGAVQEILDELMHRSTTGYVENSVLGCVAAAAGRHAEARALLSRGMAEHEPYVEFSQSPAWAPFRADPEGRALLEAAGY